MKPILDPKRDLMARGLSTFIDKSLVLHNQRVADLRAGVKEGEFTMSNEPPPKELQYVRMIVIENSDKLPDVITVRIASTAPHAALASELEVLYGNTSEHSAASPFDPADPDLVWSPLFVLAPKQAEEISRNLAQAVEDYRSRGV